MVAFAPAGESFPIKQLDSPVAAPSIRTLARQLGLSAATVSLALRDSPRVVAATKRRVRQAAARAGYRPNALVSSVMTGLRRAAHGSFQGTLMAVNWSAEANPVLIAYHRAVLDGAQRRAAELGYSLAHTWVGPRVLSLARLDAILKARGVQGVVVMPFAETCDFSALDWPGLAGVMMDLSLSAPLLSSVLPDHHLSLFRALRKLAALGYRRPGLVLDERRDARLNYRWSAGYWSFSRQLGRRELVPVLLGPAGVERDAFLAWFEKHRPDCVVAHQAEKIIGWLGGIGVRVPADAGFLLLNWTERTAPCAALDLQPAVLGAAAVEAVVAQLHRNERGIPENPKTILLPARWVDGPTLRPAAAGARIRRASLPPGGSFWTRHRPQPAH